MDVNNSINKPLGERVVMIRGAGDIASGVACRLYRANFRRIVMLETASPLAVRRLVSFCEAVHEGEMTVEGIEAVRVERGEERRAWEEGNIAVTVDPTGESIAALAPDVFIDATLAKRNLGTSISDAGLVIGLGPGFTAGVDCHYVIETNRGHDLGRIISSGQAEADTGIPGEVRGYTTERVLRAPMTGTFTACREIGDCVQMGEVVGWVGKVDVLATIGGVVRGLIRPGSFVTQRTKIGDIDPRGEGVPCATVSDKARALGGAVLEAILARYNC
jgi:xanthine dehydrogenase accessory factor